MAPGKQRTKVDEESLNSMDVTFGWVEIKHEPSQAYSVTSAYMGPGFLEKKTYERFYYHQLHKFYEKPVQGALPLRSRNAKPGKRPRGRKRLDFDPYLTPDEKHEIKEQDENGNAE
ncbi:MAG: hypothetical protein Q9166_008178, partial [cf. Caloplaca sp. 2 TL-2023]